MERWCQELSIWRWASAGHGGRTWLSRHRCKHHKTKGGGVSEKPEDCVIVDWRPQASHVNTAPLRARAAAEAIAPPRLSLASPYSTITASLPVVCLDSQGSFTNQYQHETRISNLNQRKKSSIVVTTSSIRQQHAGAQLSRSEEILWN